MTYEAAVRQMIRHWNDAEREGAALHDRVYIPYHGIEIKYPGYKKIGDYALYDSKYSEEEVPPHSYYCQELYEYIIMRKDMFDTMKTYMEKIYINGIEDNPANYNDLPEDLVDLLYRIFWVTVQEDINYPALDSNTYRGRQLPFWRYFEAICAAYYPDPEHDIDYVKKLADSRRGVHAELWYNIEEPPVFYSKNVRPIM